jgi:zinc D-Ala-D-Ala carboxypeptidase
MDGPSRIQTRIAEIEGHLASLTQRPDPIPPAGVSPSAGTPGSTSAMPFDAAYQQALDSQGLDIQTLGQTLGLGELIGTGPNDSSSKSTNAAGMYASSKFTDSSYPGRTSPLSIGSLTAGLGTANAALLREASSIQVPLNLQVYGNGRIPADALTSIGIGSHRLWGPAATAFQAMTYDASREGISIGVTDSYRGYDDQVDLAQRKGLYSQGGLGATPGTSPHGWGMALDLDVDSRGQAWLRANAGRYGFVEAVPREPWHWEYQVAS